MKYLKTFESITNSIFNVDVFKRSFGITPDELEDFFVEMVDDLDLNAKVMWDRSINAAIIKIDVPVEGRTRLQEWFYENIKPRLGRIKTQLKNNFGLDYSGYQLGLSSETNFYYKLIWYKSSDLERIAFQKKSYYRFEESDFNQMCENPQILLDYLEKNMIKESFEIGMGAHNIVNDFGLTMDDIEELFLEFSDMGYRVRIMKRSLAVGEKPGLLFPKPGHDILIVDIIGIGDKSNDPDIILLKEKIIRNSEKLGLNMVESPKRVTQFMQKSDLRFKFDKL